MQKNPNELAKRLGYEFKNADLLAQALKHRSAGQPHNERLEFLGDSVVNFVISSELYQRHADVKEGGLSCMRSSLVNGETLAQLALEKGVNHYLCLGAGEKKTGGHMRESILADAMEAIIGAIYLDAGLDVCYRCIVNWYGELVDDLSAIKPTKDAKSELQEWLQARKYPLPEYVLTKEGRAHELSFKVVCRVKGLPHESEGVSSSRRRAEQVAAAQFLEKIHAKQK